MSGTKKTVPWTYKNKIITEIPDGVEAFVYLITNLTNNRKYIGKGLNWLVKKDKEYTGYNADVAEFNDIFMRGAMGLDCDGTWKSCINLARNLLN